MVSALTMSGSVQTTSLSSVSPFMSLVMQVNASCVIWEKDWPIANPAMLPGVQERVVRRFDRWVRGEDLAAQQRLLQQSLTVQRLIEEAHRQIGY